MFASDYYTIDYYTTCGTFSTNFVGAERFIGIKRNENTKEETMETGEHDGSYRKLTATFVAEDVYDIKITTFHVAEDLINKEKDYVELCFSCFSNVYDALGFTFETKVEPTFESRIESSVDN